MNVALRPMRQQEFPDYRETFITMAKGIG